MIELQVTAISKDNGNHDNPYEAVSEYQWFQPSSGKGDIISRQKAVTWATNGYGGEKVLFFVERVQPRADCFVNESRVGTKFLQTHPDATDQNNLLKLPEIRK